MDVVVVGIIGASFITAGPRVGLCVAVFKVVCSFKSVEGSCGVFAPG